MSNDFLFDAFARSFEARREAEMSLAEYLESCRGEPMRYASATERLLAAIGECQPLFTGAALLLAEVPNRVDEPLLLVGESKAHVHLIACVIG